MEEKTALKTTSQTVGHQFVGTPVCPRLSADTWHLPLLTEVLTSEQTCRRPLTLLKMPTTQIHNPEQTQPRRKTNSESLGHVPSRTRTDELKAWATQIEQGWHRAHAAGSTDPKLTGCGNPGLACMVRIVRTLFLNKIQGRFTAYSSD